MLDTYVFKFLSGKKGVEDGLFCYVVANRDICTDREREREGGGGGANRKNDSYSALPIPPFFPSI